MKVLEASDDISSLISALTDESWNVRYAAAKALGELKDARAVEPLISALKEKNLYVRSRAANALAEITGERFGHDHTKWQSWWQENKGEFLK